MERAILMGLAVFGFWVAWQKLRHWIDMREAKRLLHD
jgi:hypothetical protein